MSSGAVFKGATLQLWLQVTNHGIPQQLIDAQFARSEGFFSLPEDRKAQCSMVKGSNKGWEKGKQVCRCSDWQASSYCFSIA